MQTREKGSTSAAVILLVILIIAGLGWWWAHKDATSAVSTTNGTSTTTGYSYVFGDPKVSTSTVKRVVVTETPAHTVVQQVAVAGASGTRYHDSTYGLTMNFPSTWVGYRTYETSGGPNGLNGIKRIHFVAPGESSDAFVVNVFTLEQWRNIKNQENFAHQNTPSLGEGTYMGVNFRYAYSTNIYSHASEAGVITSTAVFY